MGIVASNFLSTSSVSDNTIHTLTRSNTGAIASRVLGIQTSANGIMNIRRNKIYNLINLSTGTSITAPPMIVGIAPRFAQADEGRH